MLRARLWIGSLLAALGLTVLVVDEWSAPLFPGWFAFVSLLVSVSCYELVTLLRKHYQVPRWPCYLGVALIVLGNWAGHLLLDFHLDADELPPLVQALVPWSLVFSSFVLVLLLVFCREMAAFREPGGAVVRMGLTVWAVAYLGLLTSFVVQLRWLGVERHASTVALALTIFVPKCCDVGAYFAGKYSGRHRMTPVLSPKKTWEGALGGLTLAALATIAVDRLAPVSFLGPTLWAEIAFGVTVGGAGILGDLGESLIKRDLNEKDSSLLLPGFGGLLDVVDAVLFAGPVAYLWIVVISPYWIAQ